MRTLDIRGVARRRWYVLVVGLLFTAVMAGMAFAVVGLSREIKASALLLPPATSVVSYPERESPGNPFLRLDGLDPALSVLVTKMASEEMSDRILSDAPQTTYTIGEDPLSQAPVVVVTASGKDGAEAGRVLDRVMKRTPVTLNALQEEAGVRPEARITLVPLVRDEETSVVWSRLLRLEILLIGVGVVSTLLLAGLLDAFVRARVARTTRSAHEPTTSSVDIKGVSLTGRSQESSAFKGPAAEQRTSDPTTRPVHERGHVEGGRDERTGRDR